MKRTVEDYKAAAAKGLATKKRNKEEKEQRAKEQQDANTKAEQVQPHMHVPDTAQPSDVSEKDEEKQGAQRGHAQQPLEAKDAAEVERPAMTGMSDAGKGEGKEDVSLPPADLPGPTSFLVDFSPVVDGLAADAVAPSPTDVTAQLSAITVERSTPTVHPLDLSTQTSVDGVPEAALLPGLAAENVVNPA